MKTIDEYLKENQNASLSEYKAYCDSISLETFNKKKETEALYLNWLAEQDGKYFFIDFNGYSRLLFKFKHSTNKITKCKTLSFYRENDNTRISKESREINSMWLNDLNPYYPEYKKIFFMQSENSCRKIIEVPEDVAKKLFDRYDTYVNPFIDDIEKMF